MILNRKYKPANVKWVLNPTEDAHAYYLGLIASDGNVTHSKGCTCHYCINDIRYQGHRNAFRITLRNEDAYILKPMVELFEIDNPLKSNMYYTSLAIYGNEITNALALWGITPNKSETLEVPINKLPDNLYGSFIRGYFDGDGCAYLSKNRVKKAITITSGSRKIMGNIQNILRDRGIKSSIYDHINENKYRINYSRLYIHTLNIYEFFKLLYNDNTDLCIRRKREKIVEMIKSQLKII